MGRKWIEKRKRGFFGWIFLVVFWLWNALMAFGLVAGVANNSADYAKLATEAERTGYAAGTGLGVMMILFFWATGAVVFGALAYFSRGRREMIEVEA